MPTTNREWNTNTTAKTVAAAFPDAVKGRTILITGVNRNGLGYETAAALASQSPATIIITGRSQARLDESLSSLHAVYPSVLFETLLADLSSQTSVRLAAATVLSWSDVPTLDIVISNAGVMNIPERTLSVDGIELHFATNHIGHFLLTNLLMPKILASAAPRIVNVSGLGTAISPVRFSDLTWVTPHALVPDRERPNFAVLAAYNIPISEESTYVPIVAYGASKTANVLFTVGLNKRLAEKGVKSFALHPGEIETELTRTTDPAWLAAALESREKTQAWVRKSMEEGAATTVVAALDEGLGEPGEGIFLEDCQISANVPPYALDEEEADRLWEVSEGLVGEKFAW